MTESKQESMWVNHKGETVPAKYVSGYDKKKERIVRKLLKEAEATNKRLVELKNLMFQQGDAIDELMYVEHHMERPKDSKGNYTFYSFDKAIRFSMKVQDVVEFDDKIRLAQDKINEFLESKSSGADQDLMLLVNNAFKTTKGRLDKSRIFGLFSLKINNQIWNDAISLIKESITTNHTRRYASIALRDDNGEYRDIQLNISSI